MAAPSQLRSEPSTPNSRRPALNTGSAESRVDLCLGALLLALFGLIAGACSTDPDGSAGSGGSASGAGGAAGFISDSPEIENARGESGYSANGGSNGVGRPAPGGFAAEHERVIEEADIVQLQDDRLYTLSRFGGLSVIDASQTGHLELLGRYKTDAQPFEMYLRGNTVVALFNYFASYVERAGVYKWVNSGRLLALDVSDPANIQLLSEQTLPGNITGSRVVGDVLYVVTDENGACYGCASHPRTVTASYNISQPGDVRRVSRMYFDAERDSYGQVTLSVMLTDERMYIGGRELSGGWGSTIDVVDISDPGGEMEHGATLRVDGELEAPWQLDEHGGVLRVLAQPGAWTTVDPPLLQTFRVNSPSDITPLASLALTLPRPERLRSARFDGDRAFVISAERTHPLLALDLSDPAQPLQAGNVAVPAWVYRMEPRGDRLLMLGFDEGNAAGPLDVSIFDVSDLSQPKQLSRVDFGGDRVNFPEDPDRVMKAFNLLETQGLITVSYSGHGLDESGDCSNFHSGTQLIDWNADTLIKRGLAPVLAQARRAFVHQGRLFTVADDRAQTWDISDRDHPAETTFATLLGRVSQSIQVGDSLLRLGTDWWTGGPKLDVVPAASASKPEPLGSVDLQSLKQGSCPPSLEAARMFSHGNVAYLAYSSFPADHPDRVAIVDVADPASPKLIAQHKLERLEVEGNGNSQVVALGERVAQVGSTLAFLQTAPKTGGSDARVLVVDLSDPVAPKTSLVALPKAYGFTGLVSDGTSFYTSHYEPLAGDSTHVRFYVDRIDVTQLSAPKLSQINVPGSLLSVDSSGKIITLGYSRQSEQMTPAECYTAHTNYAGHKSGTCTWHRHALQLLSLGADHATLESDLVLADRQRPQRVAMGDVLFAQLDIWWNLSGEYTPPRIQVVSGIAEGRLEVTPVGIPDPPKLYSFLGSFVAAGKRAAFLRDDQALGVVDASIPGAPALTQDEVLSSYPLSLAVSAEQIYLSVGYDGVETRALR